MPVRYHLDTTGTLCPVPLLLTARRVGELLPGAHLDVVGDDPAMAQDLRDWCAQTGHRLLLLETTPGGQVRATLEVVGRDDSRS